MPTAFQIAQVYAIQLTKCKKVFKFCHVQLMIILHHVF